MEIRFSETYSAARAQVENTAERHQCRAVDIRHRANSVRFRLVPGTTDHHDRVIRALLQLDPDATIRTARAIYSGLDDYEAQLKARVP